MSVGTLLTSVAGYAIEVVSYDPEWVNAYEAERTRLTAAIGERVLRFEHMGSTSVPGLDAKPIIDISAAVSDLTTVPNLFEVLNPLGYKPIEQKSEHRYDLWRMSQKGYPSHILHFMAEGSDAWIYPIVFRNALRADPNLREEYSALKRQLAAECGTDIDRYGSGKTEFIGRVVEEMLASTGP